MSFIQKHSRSLVALLIVAVAAVGIYLQFHSKTYKHYTSENSSTEYKEVYTLVDNTISKSASIAVHVPVGMTLETTKTNVSFEPQIAGNWLESSDETTLYYKPKTDLEVGKAYTVALKIDQAELRKDFLVAENPEIEAIFPKQDSETNEDSEITIMFNRPMVPLSSLEVLENQILPVKISPETQGKFKWTGTKTLQFIPDSTLIPSSHYTIEISPEFASLEDLEIKGVSHSFTTRPLRYESVSSGPLVYNQPIRVKFNQPVDKDRTAAEMSMQEMIDTEAGNEVSFVVEYGSQKIWNKEHKRFDETEDQSSLLVYLEQDTFLRPKLWNFTKNYQLWIAKAYPKQGDIILEEQKFTLVEVSDVIQSISAESERSSFVAQNFFDPAGTLSINFHEEIDLSRSKIDVQKMQSLNYGEKCQDESTDGWVDPLTCDKVENHKQLILSLQSSDLAFGEIIPLKFERIVNMDGLTINPNPIEENIRIIPELEIFKTVPEHNQTSGSLTELTLCSSTPLTPIAASDINDYLKSSTEYEFSFWDYPRQIYDSNAKDSSCAVGQFENTIHYGLIPESDYRLELSPIDHFDRTKNMSLSFKTGAVPGKSLELFDYQQSYNVGTPQKNSLTYAVKNMDFVNLEICRMEAKSLLGLLERNTNYQPTSSQEGLCLEKISQRIELTPKYWVRNFFQINLADYVKNIKGHYLVTLSHPDFTDERGNARYQENILTITDLSLVEKRVEVWNQEQADDNLRQDQKSPLKNLYWITKLSTLEPVADATVELYSSSKQRYENNAPQDLTLKNSYSTNAQGIAETPAGDNIRAVIVRKGDDSAILSPNENQLEWGSDTVNTERVYLYTDRPIYRPGDEVFAKGIARYGYDNQYEILKGKKIPVAIFDSRDEEVWKGELDLNDFGSFEFSFLLDKNAALGTYRIESQYYYAYFDVEEYVEAAFKVDSTSNQEEYISGDTAEIEVNASYYFGAPLEGGKVEYTLSSQDYYFDRYQDEYFGFGSAWYYCGNDCSYGDRFLKRNTMDLDSQGRAKIVEKLDLKQFFPDQKTQQSKIMVLNITVTNSSGQAISTQQSFVVHAGEYYLGLKPEQSFLGKNASFSTKVKAVDTAGKAVRVSQAELILYKIDWKNSKRREVDGGFYYRWEKQRNEVDRKDISTDSDGNFSGSMQVGETGEYELEVSGRDERGNDISSIVSLYVAGDEQNFVSIRPYNDTTLDIIADKEELNIGDEAGLIIKSPYQKAKALISLERGNIMSYEIVDINQSLYRYSFPVISEHAPNIYASVLLLSDKPELKYGSHNFTINTAEKKLDIKILSSKGNYLPGEDVTLDFEVKDFDGKPVNTELSVAVVDMSVLALKGNPKKNPVVFFYNYFPLTVSTLSNVKNILYEVDLSKQTKGGGGGDDDLANKKRGIFKDTAYWNGVLSSDENGQAQVTFTLPDDLTTWQVESVGVTKDTKLGAAYQEFVARKELMLTPLKPRFVIPGDEFSLGAKVFNQTNETQELRVSLASENLELPDSEVEKMISIPANNTETVYFNVKAPNVSVSNFGSAGLSFTMSAQNEQYQDTVENSIKLTPNDSYEVTATSAYTDQDQAQEIIYLPGNIISDKGELTINSSATLAVFLSDALQYFISYPYGCAEQIASKLAAIATIQSALNLENIGNKMEIKNIQFEGKELSLQEVVEVGLGRLYQSQKYSGGFAYYPNLGENFYLTLHLTSVMYKLKTAGFAVKEEALKTAAAYLNSALFAEKYLYEDTNTILLTAYTLSELKEYGGIGSKLADSVRAIRNDKLFLEEQISNLSLAALAITLSQNSNLFGADFKNAIYDTLENRIDIDSRGSYLASNDRQMWQYYETPIKNTALLLKALVVDERDNAILDKIVRWLLRSRSKDGAWGSTNNTLEVVEAMSTFMEWRKENKSDFNLSIDLNDEKNPPFHFNPATILSQQTLTYAIGSSSLPTEVFNTLNFKKENLNDAPNFFYYDLALRYFLPTENIPPRDEGFSISRNFYSLEDTEFESPIQEAKVGDVLKGRITLQSSKDRNFVAIEDFIPAGMELVNFNLATSDQSLLMNKEMNGDDYAEEYYEPADNNTLYPDFQENRDDRLFLFNEHLNSGSYEYAYYVRVLVPGKFQHLPAVVSEMYFPENFGRTKGGYFYVNVE